MKRYTALFALLLLPAIPASSAGTPVAWETPSISDNATWSGEILLRQTVTVAPGANLRVLPGTRVLVEPGKGIGIIVLGVLRVEGNGSAPVVFVPAAPTAERFAWEGIRLSGGRTPGHALTGLRLSGAREGISLTETSARMSDVAISGCGTGLRGFQKSEASLDNCVLEGNDTGATVSLGCTASFSGCRFDRIAGVGLDVEKGGSVRVSRCAFSRGKTGLFAMTNAPCLVADSAFSGLERGVVVRQMGRESAVSRCAFENNGVGVMAVQFCSIEVADSTFRENRTAVDVQEFSAPRVAHNRFEGNQSAVSVNRKSAPLVEGNVFFHNRDAVVLNYSSYPKISRNNFDRNDMSVRLETFMSGDWEERAGSPSLSLDEAARRGSRNPGIGKAVRRSTFPKQVNAKGNYWGPDAGRDPGKGTLGKIRDGKAYGPVKYEGFGDEEYQIDVVDFSEESTVPFDDAGPRVAATKQGAN